MFQLYIYFGKRRYKLKMLFNKNVKKSKSNKALHKTIYTIGINMSLGFGNSQRLVY